ncbi:hypothetical protein FGO68_gene9163 [Halteria grandinella]|uniref:Uncharacterized protein n=1 Tax=Halteria grandinella TaxID=5974 RepID=A0A8J8N948_HALGN|nr:hypothetical protein FGO68_gene9163 [Halteria grandinella]
MGGYTAILRPCLEPTHHLVLPELRLFPQTIQRAFQEALNVVQSQQIFVRQLLDEIKQLIHQVGDTPSYLQRSLVHSEKLLLLDPKRSDRMASDVVRPNHLFHSTRTSPCDRCSTYQIHLLQQAHHALLHLQRWDQE